MIAAFKISIVVTAMYTKTKRDLLMYLNFTVIIVSFRKRFFVSNCIHAISVELIH